MLKVESALNTDTDLNPLVASSVSDPTANGEETAASSEPVTVDHSSEHRLSPSISCHDKAIEPRIELREAFNRIRDFCEIFWQVCGYC